MASDTVVVIPLSPIIAEPCDPWMRYFSYGFRRWLKYLLQWICSGRETNRECVRNVVLDLVLVVFFFFKGRGAYWDLPGVFAGLGVVVINLRGSRARTNGGKSG